MDTLHYCIEERPTELKLRTVSQRIRDLSSYFLPRSKNCEQSYHFNTKKKKVSSEEIVLGTENNQQKRKAKSKKNNKKATKPYMKFTPIGASKVADLSRKNINKERKEKISHG